MKVELNVTHEGCTGDKVRATADSITTPYGQWILINNACVSQAALDLPSVITVDRSVIANYQALKYRIYPEGQCQIIGADGVGCH